MEVLHVRCAGLDVQATNVVACARIAEGATVTYDHRTFSTSSRGLIELADWLKTHGCTHAAMEATGVYWGSQCGISSKAPSRSRSRMRCTVATSPVGRAM